MIFLIVSDMTCKMYKEQKFKLKMYGYGHFWRVTGLNMQHYVV